MGKLNLGSQHHTRVEVGVQLRLYRGIALASGIFEFFAIQNMHFSAAIIDDPRFLKDASGHGYAGATRTQHAGHQFLREGQGVHANPVLRHQEPTRQALVDFVQPVAGSDLLRLQSLEVGETGEESLEHGKFRQKFVKCIGVNSHRLA